MDKSMIAKILLVLLVFLVIGFVLYFVLDDGVSADEKHFKEEYESLNGKKNDYNKTYVQVSLPKSNNVKYASYEEAMDFLDNGSGILYLGFPECPWCRNMVPVLIDAAIENEVENVYYFNALSIRDIKELKDGKVVTKKKGTDEYYKLVDKLEDYLGPYEGLNDDSIKRIYFPTVVFIMGGKIVGVHIGTVDSQKDPYKVLDSKQVKELKKIYTQNINKIYGVCDESC